MAKFLILGDPHLGKGLSIGKSVNNLNSRVQDQINLLNFTLETAVNNNVDAIIITGDVYQEPRPHPAIIKIFMEWLMECVSHNVEVHIIAGNHDIIRSGAYSVSALDIIPVLDLPNVNVYKDVKTINYKDVSLIIVPFRDRIMYNVSTLEDAHTALIAEIKAGSTPTKGNLTICIGHVAIEGSLYVGDEIDNVSVEIFCPVSDFKDYDFTWMGHIHHPQILATDPYVAHIGSMDRSDFGTTETKYDKILILVDSEIKSFEKIILPNRHLRHFKIEIPENKEPTEFFVNSLYQYNTSNSLKDCILKIDITLEGSAEHVDRRRVEKYAYENMGVFNIPYFHETRNISVVAPDKQAVLTTSMGEEAAVLAYADTLPFDDDADKDLYIEICMSLIKEVKS
jgi:DNA repair exonuclease SbcCD nuclease subunit